MKRLIVVVLVAAAVAWGCQGSPPFDPDGYACDPGGICPVGYACRGFVCRPADAGVSTP